MENETNDKVISKIVDEIKNADEDLANIGNSLLKLSNELLQTSTILFQVYKDTLNVSLYKKIRILSALSNGLMHSSEKLCNVPVSYKYTPYTEEPDKKKEEEDG